MISKAGLGGILTGDKLYTLLAPDERAFSKLPKAALQRLMADSKLAKELIGFCFIPGVLDYEPQEKNGWFVNGKTLSPGKHSLRTMSGDVVIMEVVAGKGATFNGAGSPRTPWHLVNGRIYELSSPIMSKALAKKLGIKSP